MLLMILAEILRISIIAADNRHNQKGSSKMLYRKNGMTKKTEGSGLK